MKKLYSGIAFLGSPEVLSIERRCFSACTLAASVISFLVLITALLLSLPLVAISVSLLFFLIFISMYLLSRQEKKLSGLAWLYILVILTYLAIDWFVLGGYTGMALPVTVALSGMLPIIVQQRQLIYGMILLSLFLLLLYSGAIMFPYAIPQHPPTVLHLSDRFIDITALSICFCLLINIVMKTYREQREMLSSLNKMLEEKNNEQAMAIREIESLAAKLDASYQMQQKISNELKVNNDFLDTIFETLPLPIFYKDCKLQIIRVNSAFCEVLDVKKVKKEQILGRKVEDIGREITDVELSISSDEEVLKSGRTQNYETSVKYSDGLFHHVIVNKKRQVDGAGNPVGILGSLTDITERKIREEQIQYLAHHDSLTGLNNRSYFYIELSKKIARARRKGEKLAVFFIDLDGFKQINDRLGHHAGDFTLKTVGARLRDTSRDYDTVCRLGGDEFGIILDDVSTALEVESVVGKILASLREEIVYNKEKCFLSGSIGIAFFPDNGSTREDLIKAADEAMYNAKAKGKNQYVISAQVSS